MIDFVPTEVSMHSNSRIIAVLLAACIACSVGGSKAYSLDKDHDRGRDKCEQRIHKAEMNLNHAIRKHGERSRQAEQRRRQLEEARERCGRGMGHDHDRDHR
jgi:predicted  nucleic acid-binding Zn-ribbon protein